MTKRIRSLVIAIAAIAAMATGGAVFAQAQNSTSTPAPQERAASENTAADPDNVQDEHGKDDASEAPEKAEGPEKGEAPGKEGAEGSEVPDDDGPGGHADEPGNPNADHQFEGKE